MRKALGFSFPFDSYRHGNSSNRRPCRKQGLGVQAARKQSVFLSSCSNSTGGQSQMKASVARALALDFSHWTQQIRTRIHQTCIYTLHPPIREILKPWWVQIDA